VEIILNRVARGWWAAISANLPGALFFTAFLLFFSALLTASPLPGLFAFTVDNMASPVFKAFLPVAFLLVFTLFLAAFLLVFTTAVPMCVAAFMFAGLFGLMAFMLTVLMGLPAGLLAVLFGLVASAFGIVVGVMAGTFSVLVGVMAGTLLGTLFFMAVPLAFLVAFALLVPAFMAALSGTIVVFFALLTGFLASAILDSSFGSATARERNVEFPNTIFAAIPGGSAMTSFNTPSNGSFASSRLRPFSVVKYLSGTLLAGGFFTLSTVLFSGFQKW